MNMIFINIKCIIYIKIIVKLIYFFNILYRQISNPVFFFFFCKMIIYKYKKDHYNIQYLMCIKIDGFFASIEHIIFLI